jgi:hypothetical protein
MDIVKCLTCGEWVMVDMISFGYGEVAICPICGKLAYSSGREEDKEEENPYILHEAELERTVDARIRGDRF